MSKAKGIREVAYVDIRAGGGDGHAHHGGAGIHPLSWTDCAGGGQVVVERNIAYVGNMRNPHGTLIFDVADPKHPKLLSEIQMPKGTHSHKVRVSGDLMLTNREVLSAKNSRGETPPGDFHGGLGIYDVSNPAKPKLITLWQTDDKPGVEYARGVHRFDFDGRYAYISPTIDGYQGNIAMMLDMKNPEKPEEAMRWWMPGQWVAGGETPMLLRLMPGTIKTLGRTARADLIVDAALVSRLHCRLTADKSDQLVVEDLESSNGTMVNGERIERAVLRAGDELTVGRVTFAVKRSE